jgi:hypothetical protein
MPKGQKATFDTTKIGSREYFVTGLIHPSVTGPVCGRLREFQEVLARSTSGNKTSTVGTRKHIKWINNWFKQQNGRPF